MFLGLTPATDAILSRDRRPAIYVTAPGVWDLLPHYRADRGLADAFEANGIAWTDGGLVLTQGFFDQLSTGMALRPVPQISRDLPGRTKFAIGAVPSLFQRIRISVPDSVKRRQDFSIQLSIDGYSGTCVSGEQLVLLSSSTSATARTSDRCQAA
jgi:hypothetical protein